ncbi:MAG: dTDP-4-dehydrorhamnose 3,5-epimerase [Pseudomonadales bacterium]|nr:dTDP-4-dehydrorhamnose 3,5-epimerase [Pseudomonadales bacterium]
MKITEVPIPGAFLVDIDALEDERGFFARTVCRETFAEYGMNADFIQQSVSFNNRRGILRGMHYQAAPHEEEKLVRVTSGAVYDVIVDLRVDSPTYRHSYGVELSAQNRRALYIPKGVAHGFQSLTDDTEVFYQMTEVFHPASARGIRWDDPQLAIAWPDAAHAILSDKDRGLPLMSET